MTDITFVLLGVATVMGVIILLYLHRLDLMKVNFKFDVTRVWIGFSWTYERAYELCGDDSFRRYFRLKLCLLPAVVILFIFTTDVKTAKDFMIKEDKDG